MKKYTYYLGLNDKDTKEQIIPTWKALYEVERSVMSQLWGGSIALVKGLFKHEDGTQVIEETIRIESLGFRDESEFIAFAHYLKLMYNQESVLMEVTEVDAQFI